MADRLFPTRDAVHAASRRAQANPAARDVSATPAEPAPSRLNTPHVPVSLLELFTDTELAEVRNLLVSAGDLSNETADLIERQRRVNVRISEIVAAVRARNPQVT